MNWSNVLAVIAGVLLVVAIIGAILGWFTWEFWSHTGDESSVIPAMKIGAGA